MLILSRKVGERILIGPPGLEQLSLTLISTEPRLHTATLQARGLQPQRLTVYTICDTMRIAHQISAVLVEVKGKTARIGINAPRHIPVHREEIAERIAAEEAEIAGRKAGAL